MSDRCLKVFDDEGEIIRCELDAGHATNHISGDWIWADKMDNAADTGEPKCLAEDWCFTCDRPKQDCGCVENGGNY